MLRQAKLMKLTRLVVGYDALGRMQDWWPVVINEIATRKDASAYTEWIHNTREAGAVAFDTLASSPFLAKMALPKASITPLGHMHKNGKVSATIGKTETGELWLASFDYGKCVRITNSQFEKLKQNSLSTDDLLTSN